MFVEPANQISPSPTMILCLLQEEVWHLEKFHVSISAACS